MDLTLPGWGICWQERGRNQCEEEEEDRLYTAALAHQGTGLGWLEDGGLRTPSIGTESKNFIFQVLCLLESLSVTASLV